VAANPAGACSVTSPPCRRRRGWSRRHRQQRRCRRHRPRTAARTRVRDPQLAAPATGRRRTPSAPVSWWRPHATAATPISTWRLGYLVRGPGGRLAIDPAAVRAAARMDGTHVLLTGDDTLTPEDVALGDKSMMIIEACLRRLTTTGLRIRPVCHWTAHGIHQSRPAVWPRAPRATRRRDPHGRHVAQPPSGPREDPGGSPPGPGHDHCPEHAAHARAAAILKTLTSRLRARTPPRSRQRPRPDIATRLCRPSYKCPISRHAPAPGRRQTPRSTDTSCVSAGVYPPRVRE
jgi:hypothetical protein